MLHLRFYELLATQLLRYRSWILRLRNTFYYFRLVRLQSSTKSMFHHLDHLLYCIFAQSKTKASNIKNTVESLFKSPVLSKTF